MADRRGRTSIRTAAQLAVLALVVAACGTTTPTASLPGEQPSPSLEASAAPSATATLVPPTAAPPSPSPEPVETTPAGPAQCEPADIKASHGRVEGAAGSVFTEVELVAGIACSVDLFPAFGLKDGNGSVLVGAAAQGPGRIDLVAGASYTSNVRLANWCADDPDFPLRFELIIAGETEAVTGATPFPDDGDIPPCNGQTTGRILEATSWVAAP